VDVTRAQQRFGFTASTGLRDGLTETVAWYERNRDRLAGREGSRGAAAS
jgi:GDP-L-fucose synthase